MNKMSSQDDEYSREAQPDDLERWCLRSFVSTCRSTSFVCLWSFLRDSMRSHAEGRRYLQRYEATRPRFRVQDWFGTRRREIYGLGLRRVRAAAAGFNGDFAREENKLYQLPAVRL